MSTPEERTDELLSAPDTTAKSETERKKYRLRKKHEEARAAQLRQQKRNELPTIEDMLADLVRVAEDPDNNPYHAQRIISRKRYDLYGHYPLECLEAQFGQFNHALEVAGLRDQPGMRLKKAARAVASRTEHAARYVKRYVHPYVAKRDDYSTLNRPYLLLSISDTHALFLDPFTWHCFLSAIRDLQPDAVLLNGDILEGSEITRHPQIPGWTVPLQLEFDFLREMIRQIRELHEGDLFLGGGNHGIDRLTMYLTQQKPALACLRTMRIDKLMELEEYNVQLMQGGTILSPEGQEDDEQGFLLFGFYRPHHGTKLGQHPAFAELKAIGRSGQSGHVHRADMAFGCTEKDKGLSWMCTPMGCTERVARHYIKSPNKGWQKGFGVAWLFPGEQVRQYPVLTDGDVCFVEGFRYERAHDTDPDPTRLWLPELPIPCVTR